MSIRTLLPLLALIACASADPVDENPVDDTNDTDQDTDETNDDTDEDVEDTDAAEDTDEDTEAPGLATAWTGTWSFRWEYYELDPNHPGPGQKWDPVNSSCSAGTVSLNLDEDGQLVVEAPFGVCTTGTQINWTHMALDGVLDEAGTGITGTALFGRPGGPQGFQVGFGLPITGTISADGDVPMGVLTLSGSRVQNQEMPQENLQFTATLRPDVE